AHVREPPVAMRAFCAAGASGVTPAPPKRPLGAHDEAEQREHLPVVPERLAGPLTDLDTLRIAPRERGERIRCIDDPPFGRFGNGLEQIGPGRRLDQLPRCGRHYERLLRLAAG